MRTWGGREVQLGDKGCQEARTEMLGQGSRNGQGVPDQQKRDGPGLFQGPEKESKRGRARRPHSAGLHPLGDARRGGTEAHTPPHPQQPHGGALAPSWTPTPGQPAGRTQAPGSETAGCTGTGRLRELATQGGSTDGHPEQRQTDPCTMQMSAAALAWPKATGHLAWNSSRC